MINSILLTFLAGFFIFLGGILVLFIKNKEKLHSFSIGLSIGVLVLLLFLELLPESFELINSKLNTGVSALMVFLISLGGIGIIKMLDKYVPEHNVIASSHIALITSIALFIHNVIEGMALYATCQIDIMSGILLVIGVSMHNFALGLSISSEYYAHNNKNKEIMMILIFLTFSTLFGGLIMMIFNVYLESSLILGIILSLTVGMIIFIVFFELIPHIKEIKNKKTSFVGILVGILLITISMFIE